MKQGMFFRVMVLTAAVLLCLTAGAAAAEPAAFSGQLALIQEGCLPHAAPQVQLQSQAADACLYEGLRAAQTSIDVAQFALPCDAETGSSPALTGALERVINDHPELFYVSGQYTFRARDGIVTEVCPVYTMTGVELQEASTWYSTTLQGILDQIDPHWTDFEKLLFINDYLTSHYEYDLTYSIYDVEDFLTYGTGVCQAYYLTCRALLNELGIPSCSASSDWEMHIWNVVYLDGSWYHLDITWNDPVYDSFGLARHRYFLVSTEGLYQQDAKSSVHHDRTDWYSDRPVSCTDTRYDRHYWKNVETPYVKIGSDWYYSNDEAICRTSDPKIEGTPVIFHGQWPEIGFPGWNWMGAFTGLGSYDDWLIYNTDSAVMAYHPADGESRIIYQNTDETRGIYSLLVHGDTVICALSDSPMSPEITKLPCSLQMLGYPGAHKTVFRGVTIYEGGGQVTIVGKPTSAQPFFLAAAGYSAQGKLLDIQMLSSADLTGTTLHWQLKGDRTRIFFLNPNYTPAP